MYYDNDYESIDDIAKGEGFFIDDDGNWVPLEDALDFGYEPEDLEFDYDYDFDIDEDDYNEGIDD